MSSEVLASKENIDKKPGFFRSVLTLLKFSRRPILVGGCGRTGTSLMSAILGAHPEIICYNEESYIFSKKRKFGNSRLNFIYNLFAFYVSLINQGIPEGKRTWCEKTPKNVRKLDELLMEFRNNVKIILMIRNSYDVLTSRHPNVTDSSAYYISLERWKMDSRITLQFKDHPQVLIVPYEKLIGDFEITMKKVFSFLEMSFSDRVKKFNEYTSVSSHLAFHSGKVSPIYGSSVERWKKPEHKARIDEINGDPEALKLMKSINEITKEF